MMGKALWPLPDEIGMSRFAQNSQSNSTAISRRAELGYPV